MDFRVGARLLPALMAIGLPLLALVAWVPTFFELRSTSSDQVAESFGIAAACQPGRVLLGWLGRSIRPKPSCCWA